MTDEVLDFGKMVTFFIMLNAIFVVYNISSANICRYNKIEFSYRVWSLHGPNRNNSVKKAFIYSFILKLVLATQHFSHRFPHNTAYRGGEGGVRRDHLGRHFQKPRPNYNGRSTFKNHRCSETYF